MALTLTKEIPRFIKSCSLVFIVTSAVQKIAINLNYDRKFIQTLSDLYHKQYQNPSLPRFFTTIQPERLCWAGSPHAVLLSKLEIAMKDCQLDEALETFNDFKSLYGFPESSLVNGLITQLAYSSEPIWLQKACDLVFLILKEKSYLLQHDVLTKLTICLARAQMPSPATMSLRLMLEKETLPPINVLWLVFLHLVKTEIGTCLASNFLVELCHSFHHSSGNKSNRPKLMKPDTMIFNLVLDACVRFGSSFKGQQIMELMPQIGVIADAHSVVIIARIHEMNGQRYELKKYKDHIPRVSIPFVHHYRQFFDSLLNLHFKFDDIDAAAELVLDMYRHLDCLPIKNDRKDSQKPSLVPIGSRNLRNGLKIQIAPELLQRDSVLKLEVKQELVLFRSGRLGLSNKALAKFINGYRRVGKISELSMLLLTFQRKLCTLGGSCLCCDVVDACIHLGWLETAHDILDDMESAGATLGLATYVSLLTAYYKAQMFREAKALLKQMKKAGLVFSFSDEMDISTCLSILGESNLSSQPTLTAKSDLVESLAQEVREEEMAVPSIVYEFNSSIYFFCKAKMIGDALRTYRRMQEMKIQPTAQTYINLVHGYSSLEMYRDITILWGDIKRKMESGNLVVSRDLYEFLLLNFLRGGYFERVMEVIGHMKKKHMYADKWLYKSEFLKFHKNLYRNLKMLMATTEAQKKRLEFVCAFRKWAGID